LAFLNRLLEVGFLLLYTHFAWTYDAVAWLVSAGAWRSWVLAALPFARGGRVLEIGHGPGHLLAALGTAGRPACGVDASSQMGRIAHRRLHSAASPPRLARARVEALPFPAAAFDTILSTFPTSYIFQPEVQAELRRILVPGGRLVVLLAAWTTSHSLRARLAGWIYRLAGQALPKNIDESRLTERFTRGGFQAHVQWVEQAQSRLIFVIAEAPV
jgi:ubiquinone/menaquinone biosynthesis C-methylase UbiE